MSHTSFLLLTISLSGIVSAGLIAQREDSGPGLHQRNVKNYSWIARDAGTIPYKCNFVYAGGSNRLLYVGRVESGLDIVPAAIHHYGQGGSETVRFINNNSVQVQKNVEWLCGSDNNVGWVRVKDLSPTSLEKANAIAVGYNSTTQSATFGCLAHSFFSDKYPASVGQVKNGFCEFEVRGAVVSTENFDWWHTLEVLATLQ